MDAKFPSPRSVSKEAGVARSPWTRAVAFAFAAALGALAIALLALASVIGASYLRGRELDLPFLRISGAPGPVAALPEGTVIALQGEECPFPWQAFRQAQGRFLLGAGDGSNRDANGTRLTPRRSGETGGQAGVELFAADMPPHSHHLSLGRVVSGTGASVAIGGSDGPGWGLLTPYIEKYKGTVLQGHRQIEAVERVGGVVLSDGQARARRHDNVPPYVAVTYCILSSTIALDLAAARH